MTPNLLPYVIGFGTFFGVIFAWGMYSLIASKLVEPLAEAIHTDIKRDAENGRAAKPEHLIYGTYHRRFAWALVCIAVSLLYGLYLLGGVYSAAVLAIFGFLGMCFAPLQHRPVWIGVTVVSMCLAKALMPSEGATAKDNYYYASQIVRCQNMSDAQWSANESQCLEASRKMNSR